MHQIPVQVMEEDKAITLVRIRLAGECDAERSQVAISRVKITHRNRQMSQSRRTRLAIRAFPLRRNNLDHSPILGTNEEVAVIFEIDSKTKCFDVPLS